VAAARLARCREVVTRIAAEHRLPPENLIAPDAVRRLAWTPPEKLVPASVAAALAGTGARHWQIDLIVDELTAALADPGADPDADPGVDAGPDAAVTDE
jgi:ribonuclease D